MFLRQLSFGDRQRQQYLDVDLVVRRVDAGRIVDGVGVKPDAAECGLDTTKLGQTEIAAFAHHLAAQLRTVDAQNVVGAIADIGVRFAASP